MLRRTALRSLAIAAILSVLPACGKSKSEGSAATTQVKLALNWVPEPEFGGFYAARESGAFTRAKLDVAIQGGGAGVPVVQRVAAGQVEFGIAGADEILIARARGADVLPLFTTYQTSPQGLMAHGARKVKGIGELFESGTVAMEPGLPAAAFLKKKYGAAKAKVVPYDGGIARFLAEPDYAQQCYVFSEPIAAKKKGGDPQTFLIADEGFNPYVGVVITSGAYFKEHPDVVRAFVGAVKEGWLSYLKDPKPANDVMAKLNTAMDAETFALATEAQKKLVEGDAAKGESVGAMSKERWEKLAAQLVEIGVLDKAPAAGYLVALP